MALRNSNVKKFLIPAPLRRWQVILTATPSIPIVGSSLPETAESDRSRPRMEDGPESMHATQPVEVTRRGSSSSLSGGGGGCQSRSLAGLCHGIFPKVERPQRACDPRL